jgi:hypothetical protein
LRRSGACRASFNDLTIDAGKIESLEAAGSAIARRIQPGRPSRRLRMRIESADGNRLTLNRRG